MDELLSNLNHLMSVIGTIFMISVLLIALAKMLCEELHAIEYIVKIAQGLTYAFAVTAVVMAIASLI